MRPSGRVATNEPLSASRRHSMRHSCLPRPSPASLTHRAEVESDSHALGANPCAVSTWLAIRPSANVSASSTASAPAASASLSGVSVTSHFERSNGIGITRRGGVVV